MQAYDNYTKFCTRGKRDLGYDIQDGEKTVEDGSFRHLVRRDVPLLQD